MNICIIILAVLILLSGNIYVSTQKKKLTDEMIVVFERSIKPKVIRYYILGILPLLAVAVYLMSGNFKGLSFILLPTGLTIFVLDLLGYVNTKKTIQRSEFPNETKYILNYFVFSFFGNILMLIGIALTFNKFIRV